MTPQIGLASHAFSKCMKSFKHLISDITLTNIQLNEIERRHLQQLYLKWENASFLESDLQLFFDMKEHHQILNQRLEFNAAWVKYIEAADLFRLQIMMAIHENDDENV